jgi:hypothetical protein
MDYFKNKMNKQGLIGIKIAGTGEYKPLMAAIMENVLRSNVRDRL